MQEAGLVPSPPSTPLSLTSSADETITPSGPVSPPPQVSPLQSLPPSPPSQVFMVSVASAVRPALGDNTRPDYDPTTIRYLDDTTPEMPSNPHAAQNIRGSNSQPPATRPEVVAPILFSPADGPYDQLGSSSSGGGFSGSAQPREIDIVWPSVLSPGFPHFELPSIRFGLDNDVSDDQGVGGSSGRPST